MSNDQTPKPTRGLEALARVQFPRADDENIAKIVSAWAPYFEPVEESGLHPDQQVKLNQLESYARNQREATDPRAREPWTNVLAWCMLIRDPWGGDVRHPPKAPIPGHGNHEQKDWFSIYLDAQMYQGLMEGAFSERWPHYHKFGGDSYDGSIELYFKPECPADWKPTPEDLEFLKTYGVHGGWMNFTDGTEIHFCINGPYERRQLTHPRWSVEKYQEEMER